MIDALILAGAANSGKLKDASSQSAEALIEVHGRPMVWYVVNTLLLSERIGRVLVVGPPEIAQLEFGERANGRVEFALSGEHMVENMLRGIEHLAGERQVLIVTSDIPLLTVEAVDDFISRCAAKSADLYYPIVTQEANEAKYPGVERTYVHLKEGTFTGGNLALVSPQVLKRAKSVIEQAFAMRKKPVQLARLLGFRFILKLIVRRLSVHEIEARAARILGCNGVAIISPYPELGIDIDKPSDLALVESVLVPPENEPPDRPK